MEVLMLSNEQSTTTTKDAIYKLVSAEIEVDIEPEQDSDSGAWSLAENEISPVMENISDDIIPLPPPLPPLPKSIDLTELPGHGISDESFIAEFAIPLSSITSNINRLRQESEMMSIAEYSECPICLESTAAKIRLPCCDYFICKDCMNSIIQVNITQGISHIPCPNDQCSQPLRRDFLVDYMPTEEIRLKYERFRLNYEGDGTEKTCPNCCLITKRESATTNVKKLPVDYFKVSCEACEFEWCFNCHSPWHEGLTCKAYKVGDKQFHHWTKERRQNMVPNCQKCPFCKVFIQRSEGCDHMTCNRCSTHFCYKCGGRFNSFPVLGDHHQKLSVLGCPYNYNGENSTRRRVVRGGYLFVRCAALTGYPILLVGGVIIVVIGAAIILPIVGLAVLRKKIKRWRRNRRRRN